MSQRGYSTEGFERSVHTIDGVDSVVYSIGPDDGTPLVYFHGGGTFHGFEWARPLADRFRVILPHHPNFGESGDGEFDQGLDDYLTHYEMLFAALGLEQFHLVGASMGGHMAARYAGEHADEIDRLVLVSPAGLESAYASMPDFTKVEPQALPAMFVADPAWITPFWPSDPSPEWLGLREREGAAAFRTREDLGEADAKLRAFLRGFSRPTLLLWGEDDRIVPLGYAREWQTVLPGAQLDVIPGGSHLLLDEFPAAVEAMRSFLEA